jgi:hypothetical protein
VIVTQLSATGIVLGDVFSNSHVPNVNGSDSFNPVDLVGFFPQMIFISLCSFLLLLRMILKLKNRQSVSVSVPFFITWTNTVSLQGIGC